MIKNVLKIILLIAVIALIAFIIITARNINIINRYSRKVDEYQKATNFYAKIEDEYGTRELWRKDDTGITKDIANDGVRILYVKGEEMWNIMDTTDEQGNNTKMAYKSQNEEQEEIAFLPVIETSTFYVEDNFWEKLKAAFTVKISSENVNGKDCYKFHINNDFEVFVNKKDYMKVKEVNCGTTTQITDYKFNSVEDSDVAMPSLEGYDIES